MARVRSPLVARAGAASVLLLASVLATVGCELESVDDPGALEVDEAGAGAQPGQGDSFANRGARIFWDSFETAGWNAELDKGRTGGSIDVGPVWWQSQMQSEDSGAVLYDPERARHGDHYMRFKWYRSPLRRRGDFREHQQEGAPVGAAGALHDRGALVSLQPVVRRLW